ncbi:Kinetochore-associated protein 1 [Geodia barretti]|nr:Kinetochore-associated protein 1 [Geodia barretti]
MLADYLKLFLARAPAQSPDFSGSPWEAKAVAVVEGVASSELRVSCCLRLLHCASSPWSSAVACLVQSCLPLTASCAQQLQSLYNLLQVQEILQEKYGIADFNFSDRTTGDVYIRHILVQQKSDALADALWVATKYGIAHSRVYVRHLFQLCCQTRVEEARDMLGSLSPKILSSTVPAAFSFSLSRLKTAFVPDKTRPASHIGAARLALLCTQLSLPAHWKGRCSAQLLRRVLELAEEFSVFVSPSQLTSPQHTAQLLHQAFASIPSSSSTNCLSCKYLRLAHLLGYSEHEVYCELVKLQQTISLSILQECPADLTLPLLYSALIGSDLSFLTPSLVQDFSCLAAHVSSSCSSKNLQQALVVFKMYSLLHDLLSVCVSEEERVLWPWSARHSESGLQLEINSSFLQLTLALLQPPSHSQDHIPVVDLLQSTGHLNLAQHIEMECQLGLGVESNRGSLQSSMLEKVLSMSRVDHSLGLALLLATPPDTALQLLNTKQSSIMSSYSRVIAFCALTIHYCQLVGLPQQVKSTAVGLMTAAVWGKTLRTYQVNFWNAFRGGPEEKKRVLSQIVHLKEVPPELLLAYCRTYGLDGAGATLTRLRLVLTEWETDFQDGFAANLVSVRRHPFISSLLTTFVTTKVCPYDYERIQFVLQELRLRGASQPQHDKMQLILSLLVDYEKRQPPAEEERSWHAAQCHGVCKAGKGFSPQRLPLHIFLDPILGLKHICREVCGLSSVERCLAIAKLIDVPLEKLYHTFLKSLNTSKISFDELAPFLASVPHVATRVDLTAELASRLPGREQVLALETVVELAKDSENPTHHLSSLEHQLRGARTAVLLEEAGLDRHVASADSCVISTLYTELPMLQQDRPSPTAVHQIAHKIADVHNINILAFTSQLLQDWLFPSTVGRQDLNTTLVTEMKEARDTKDSRSPDNWRRMIYLLTDNPHMDHLAGVLCNWAKTNSPMVGLSTRQCALQLLLTAVPQSVVERVSGGSISHLRDKMQEAVFVAELGSVQVVLKPDVFHSCNKKSVVFSLVQNRADSPKALRLAADMSVHYRLLDPDLWTKLLAALLALKMTEFLHVLLPKLVGLGAHYSVPTLSSVWQRAVQASYETGIGHDCLPALHLLYQCPVLFQLDLPAIIQTMTAAGAHSHALSACLLLPTSQRSSTIEMLLSGFPAEKLPQLLEEVTSSSCSELFLVADEVYSYVDKNGLYEYLLGTSFFTNLVQFLIARCQLSSLLSNVLSRGRVWEAAQLVEMYHDQHQVSAPAGVEGLKAYLKCEGLEIELCTNKSLS